MRLTMNLKTRFMLLMLALFLVAAGIVWILVRQLSESIVEEWVTRYAEKQVLYDKGRTLQPILTEIALSRQFANSHQLITWARNPEDPDLKRQAIAEMENYRLNFADNSYFVALRESGDYYHNNAANEYADSQYRYSLDPDRPADSWFYKIIKQNRDMHLNVNPDVELGVTKLWIDMLLRDGDEILGVVGTGLDLTHLLNSVVNKDEPGITSLFTDHDGAIQLYRDQSLIDFGSITKASADKTRVDRLFSDDADKRAVQELMQQLVADPGEIKTRFVTIDDRRHLVGLAYIPEIDWYEVTLLDLNKVLPFSHFSGILLSFGLMLLASLIMLHLALNRFVLNPLTQLESGMDEIREGHYPQSLPQTPPNNEVGRLMNHFRHMASAVQSAREELEQKVLNRTEALDRLTKTDALTELLNRRGMQEQLDNQWQLLQRERRRFGLVWLDLDHFKQINDRYGHKAGDQVLLSVAEQLRKLLRGYDYAARWGGDEFLLLIQTDRLDLIEGLSERIRSSVAESSIVYDDSQPPITITLSAGCHLASSSDETLEKALQAADTALYEAKEGGRNRLAVHSPQ